MKLEALQIAAKGMICIGAIVFTPIVVLGAATVLYIILKEEIFKK